MGHFGEVFGATASEAYVPHMVDQEYMLEDDPGLFLEPGWEVEALEAGTFQESSGSLTNRTGDNSYRVPLISQEQAYANHGTQEDQVAAVDGGPSSTASLPLGGAHWGLQERGWEQGPSPRRAKPGNVRR